MEFESYNAMYKMSVVPISDVSDDDSLSDIHEGKGTLYFPSRDNLLSVPNKSDE
jgi:hypothetical protein